MNPDRESDKQEQELTTSYMLGLLDALADGSLQVSACDPDSILKDPTLFSKEDQGKSSSVVLAGKLRFRINGRVRPSLRRIRNDVVLKISFRPEVGNSDNSFQVEADIYKNIVSWLLKQHITPNLVAYSGWFRCHGWKEWNPVTTGGKKITQALRDKARYLRRFYPREWDFSQIDILVTQMAGKDGFCKLHEWTARFKEVNDHDWITVLFQLLYTLNVFADIGLRHNDLHTGNIFVVPVTPQWLVYVLEKGKYYPMWTRFIVKIYDWDQASFTNTTTSFRNTFIERAFCKEYGVCNGPHPKYDAYTLLSILYQDKQDKDMGVPDWVFESIERVIDTDLFGKNYWAYPHRLCMTKVTGKTRTCQSVLIPEDSQFLPLSDIVRYFDSYFHTGAGLSLEPFQLPEWDESGPLARSDFVWHLPTVGTPHRLKRTANLWSRPLQKTVR